MSMRNHWVEIESSSLKNDYATGPRGKADDMTIRLYQDNNGDSEKVIQIDCFPKEVIVDNKRKTEVTTRVTNSLTGEVIFEHSSFR